MTGRDGAPLRVRAADLDVEAIQQAIRDRVRLRRADGRPYAEGDLEALAEARLARLDDWNLPRETWRSMWPPELAAWNLDDDYPIRSHRGPAGRVIVALKRALRALARLAARPLVTQQAQINRTLALMCRTLADESAAHELHVRALEARIARVSLAMRELRGEAPPLVEVVDAGAGEPG